MRKLLDETKTEEFERYEEVWTFFYCTRCNKRFWAKAIIEEDDKKYGGRGKTARLADARIMHFQTDSQAYLFCSRCTSAFYSYLRMK